MYIKHSTKIPIVLSEELIREVMINHIKIVGESKNNEQVNTDDVQCIFTQPSKCEPW